MQGSLACWALGRRAAGVSHQRATRVPCCKRRDFSQYSLLCPLVLPVLNGRSSNATCQSNFISSLLCHHTSSEHALPVRYIAFGIEYKYTLPLQAWYMHHNIDEIPEIDLPHGRLTGNCLLLMNPNSNLLDCLQLRGEKCIRCQYHCCTDI